MLKLLLRPTSFTIAFAACLFAVVVGLKWATFDRFGSAMPDWDQWDAEALNLLAPWFEHDHFAAHLFQPHNEHRVVITKLQNLTLTLLNGQWDARLEAVANALLHGALAVALWLLGRRRFASFTHAPLWLLDEPTTALDRHGQALLFDHIACHRAQGGTVIAATHDDLPIPAAQIYDMQGGAQ